METELKPLNLDFNNMLNWCLLPFLIVEAKSFLDQNHMETTFKKKKTSKEEPNDSNMYRNTVTLQKQAC